MDLAERGAFRDLLDYQYQEGSIPADPAVLARFLGVGLDEFAPVWKRVSKEFRLYPQNPSRLFHVRAAEVIAEDQEYRRKQAEHGSRGGRPKRKGSEKGTLSPPFQKPGENERVDKAPSPLLSSPLRSDELQAEQVVPTVAHRTDARRSDSPEFALQTPTRNGKPTKAEREKWFNEWWEIWPNRVARKTAREAFSKHIKTFADFEKLMRITAVYDERRWRHGQIPPNPPSFLNGKGGTVCWTDDPNEIPDRAATPQRRETVDERMNRI